MVKKLLTLIIIFLLFAFVHESIVFANTDQSLVDEEPILEENQQEREEATTPLLPDAPALESEPIHETAPVPEAASEKTEELPPSTEAIQPEQVHEEPEIQLPAEEPVLPEHIQDTEPAQEVQNPPEPKTKALTPESKATVNKQEIQAQAAASPGTLDVSLLGNTTLKVSVVPTGDCRQKITLNYSGTSLLNLGLSKSSYIIFALPPELAAIADKSNMTASYDIPGGLLNSGRVKDSFLPDKIQVKGNQVEINTASVLTLTAGATYNFSLSFIVDAIPAVTGTPYIFKAEATRESIDLSLISQKVASSELSASSIPALKFSRVPETLGFKETIISQGNAMIPVVTENSSVEINDTRGAGCSWSLQAHLSQPLTSTASAHALEGALVYRDSAQNARPLSEEPLEILKGNSSITLDWTGTDGMFVQLNTADARPETYTTNIVWTLVDAP